MSNIAGIRAPDSRLAREATEFVREASEPVLFNHAMRSYYFGALFAKSAGLKHDAELVYLGSIMHDLGLTDRVPGQERFEVEGANAARSFLNERGLSDDRSWLIWDAIALHTSPGIIAHKQPICRAMTAGIGIDVNGMNLDKLEPQAVAHVLSAYPRLGFKKNFFALLLGDAERKTPQHRGHFCGAVAHYHLANAPLPDPRRMFEAAPFDE